MTSDEHVYEVGVFVADAPADHTYEVDHRFPHLPGLDTVRALKDEAQAAYDELYPEEGFTQVNVRVTYLNAEERGGDEKDPAEVDA